MIQHQHDGWSAYPAAMVTVIKTIPRLFFQAYLVLYIVQYLDL
jgi:hypothetical protein